MASANEGIELDLDEARCILIEKIIEDMDVDVIEQALKRLPRDPDGTMHVTRLQQRYEGNLAALKRALLYQLDSMREDFLDA